MPPCLGLRTAGADVCVADLCDGTPLCMLITNMQRNNSISPQVETNAQGQYTQFLNYKNISIQKFIKVFNVCVYICVCVCVREYGAVYFFLLSPQSYILLK